MAWFGFWVFLAVCVAVDAHLFKKGYDGFFFEHKTEAEKEIQRWKIDRMKKKEDGGHGS